jgi:hypothetical protein
MRRNRSSSSAIRSSGASAAGSLLSIATAQRAALQELGSGDQLIDRGAYMMTATPIRQMAAPTMS